LLDVVVGLHLLPQSVGPSMGAMRPPSGSPRGNLPTCGCSMWPQMEPVPSMCAVQVVAAAVPSMCLCGPVAGCVLRPGAWVILAAADRLAGIVGGLAWLPPMIMLRCRGE
jgi:hypothetical protein